MEIFLTIILKISIIGWGNFSRNRRHSFPKELQEDLQQDSEAALPDLCSRIHRTFRQVCNLQRIERVTIISFWRLRETEAEEHTNTFYKHFYYFVRFQSCHYHQASDWSPPTHIRLWLAAEDEDNDNNAQGTQYARREGLRSTWGSNCQDLYGWAFLKPAEPVCAYSHYTRYLMFSRINPSLIRNNLYQFKMFMEALRVRGSLWFPHSSIKSWF